MPLPSCWLPPVIFPPPSPISWARQWPQAQIRARCRLLTGQSVLLLGFGAIARRLVELLHPFRMNIHAVRRTLAPELPSLEPALPAPGGGPRTR